MGGVNSRPASPQSNERKIDSAIFLVGSYSSEGAKETIEELLKRVIIKNAEYEFKNSQRAVGSDKTVIRSLS